MDLSNLKKDNNEETKLKIETLSEKNINEHREILLLKKSNIHPVIDKKKTRRSKKKNLGKLFRKLTKETYSKSCTNCHFKCNQSNYCNLHKNIIYDDTLYAFNCKEYTKNIANR